MYLIYKILKEIRYIMRSKSMKRLITLALLIVLLSMLCSRVFAFELTQYDNSVLTFDDFNISSMGINTATDIDNYSVLVLDTKNTVNAHNARYWVYFFPKQNVEDLKLISKTFEDVQSSSKILYLHSSTRENFTYYIGYYNKSGDKYVKKYGLIDVTTNFSGDYSLHSLFNGSSGWNIIYNSSIDTLLLDELKYCNYSLSLSTTEQTTEHVFIYTNWLQHSQANNYNIYMEMYPDTENVLNVVLNTETNIENINEYRYYFEAEENGNYRFVFYYDNGDYFNLQSKNITISNIVSSSSGVGSETGGNEQRRRNRRRRE